MSKSMRLNRRSFVGRITGGIVAGGAMALVQGGRVAAQESGGGPYDRLVFDYPGDSDACFAPHYTGNPRTDPHDNDHGCSSTPQRRRGADQDVTDNTRFPRSRPRSPVPNTDRDPTDRPGQGNGSPTEAIRRRPSGLTDTDYNDVSGNGRGRPGQGPTETRESRTGRLPTGQSDRDPTDPPGSRGGRPRPDGLTDRDPTDSAGHGRGTGANGPR